MSVKSGTSLVFRSQYTYQRPVSQNPGSRVHILRSAKYDNRGNFDVVITGEENIYDFIQSHRDSVDIHLIVQRCAAGDESALSRVQGVYADVTGMPTTYAEVLNATLAGQQHFETLPARVKEKFGNSYSQWLASVGSDEFYEKMEMVKPVSSFSDGNVQVDFSPNTPLSISEQKPLEPVKSDDGAVS